MECYLKRKEPLETDINSLPTDPGILPSIWCYDVNERDEIRRAYLLKEAHQPKNHQFPQTIFGNLARRFNPKWFEEYPDWLEYSVQKDAAFCLYCYLFKPQDKTITGQCGGDSFIGEGFINWKKKEKLLSHVGDHNSAHNKARHKCEDLMSTKEQSLHVLWLSKDERNRKDYRVMLTAAVDCVQFLLRQGLSFRGHDESSRSENRGNYLELFDFLGNYNDEIKKVSSTYSCSNLKLTSPKVQKRNLFCCSCRNFDINHERYW
ncbi:hypothetical protein MA16_Dca005509 [Dendrobium catenatum]|uniref:TTF-type domain-containing protein n=1 Tax=Dendrobium catenatum TaxID=906689 RepID=A0A2I0X3K8_9ASPA|nr:hypothetical protein MA16_Dca005509 [Dendrobium catenatum]